MVVDKGSGDAHRCDPCEKHCQTLNRMLYCVLNEQGQDQDRTAIDSQTNYHCLTPNEICEQMKWMHQQIVCSRREVEKLKECVEKLIEEHGTTVEDDLDDHLTEIMTAKSTDMESMYEDGILGRVF